MSYTPPDVLDKTSTGLLISVDEVPISQIDARFGIVASVITAVFAGAGASATAVPEKKFRLTSGTSPTGGAAILSRRVAKLRAGQGMSCKIGAIFKDGAVGSMQVAGLISSENGIGFAKFNNEFGIIDYSGGVPESQLLTLTAGASGAEVATVTVSGTGYPVNLTSGTTAVNAYQIASQLNGVVPGYVFSSNANTVVTQSIGAGPPAGAFNYSSATSTGTFAQTKAGVMPTFNFVAQADWNGESADWIDEALGNVYEIRLNYLGFNNVEYYIQDPQTSRMILVHTQIHANTSDQPFVSIPSFRGGWFVQNMGSTTSVTLEGDGCGVFNNGPIKLPEVVSAQAFEQLAVGTTSTNLISFRNRISFNGSINRSEIIPALLAVSTQGSKGMLIDVLINPTFSAPVSYSYYDVNSSLVETATTKVTVTGGKKLASLTVSGSATLVSFNENAINSVVEPGDVICIAGRVPSGAASDTQVSLTVREDL
jgi:hypothetical protein